MGTLDDCDREEIKQAVENARGRDQIQQLSAVLAMADFDWAILKALGIVDNGEDAEDLGA